jgi:hypothetical protein
MTIRTGIATALLLAATVAYGQDSHSAERPYLTGRASYATANLTKAKTNFLASLHSTNEGVLESVLGHVTHMRIMLPQEDMSEIESRIEWIAVHGSTAVIRYKAYLASMVFDNPAEYAARVTSAFESSDEFFGSIATGVHDKLFGDNRQ